MKINTLNYIIFCINTLFLISCSGVSDSVVPSRSLNLPEWEKERVLAAADKYLLEEPVTLTSFSSPRSAGGKHDFFSEGDYWWPDSTNPDGPYIQKDGMTNPENFVDHRKAMVRFSVQVAAMTAAYKITGEKRFAAHAVKHLMAWFVSGETRMNPHLLYAQAIKGRFTGRGIGIIDTIHLIEVAQSIIVLNNAGVFTPQEIADIKQWFREYMQWLTTHQYGKDEMNAKNNHGTCWVMQTAMFAKLVGDEAVMDFCRYRYKEVLLPGQMAADGGFPLELKRTKPYNYSLFNLDAMAAICQILSTEKDDLWNYTLPDGRQLKKGIEFMYPFIADKSTWKYPPDVMFYEYYPVRQPSLLFAGIAYKEMKYIELWRTLDPDPKNEEVIRNFPIRQPILWID
ncbi:MAG: alginate lyase family protein [Bacteroidota bacterium]